jgi:hypothetical protein
LPTLERSDNFKLVNYDQAAILAFFEKHKYKVSSTQRWRNNNHLEKTELKGNHGQTELLSDASLPKQPKTANAEIVEIQEVLMHIHDFHFATSNSQKLYFTGTATWRLNPTERASTRNDHPFKEIETDYEQQHHATKRDVCGHEPHGEHTPHQLKSRNPKKPDKCIEVGTIDVSKGVKKGHNYILI